MPHVAFWYYSCDMLASNVPYLHRTVVIQGCAAAEPEWEPPTADCPLRCPASRKIPKLTVKVYLFFLLFRYDIFSYVLQSASVITTQELWRCDVYRSVCLRVSFLSVYVCLSVTL